MTLQKCVCGAAKALGTCDLLPPFFTNNIVSKQSKAHKNEAETTAKFAQIGPRLSEFYAFTRHFSAYTANFISTSTGIAFIEK